MPISNVNLAHFDYLYNWKLFQYDGHDGDDDDRFERYNNSPANLCALYLNGQAKAIQSNYYVNLSTPRHAH